MRYQRSEISELRRVANVSYVLLGVALLLTLLIAPPLRADDLVVSNETELADAIVQINAAGSGLHTITMAADITLSAPLPGLNNVAADEIQILGDGFTLTGDGTSTILTILPDTVVLIEELTLTGGAGNKGGALYNQGFLTVRKSTIKENAAASGGGIHSEPFEFTTGSLIIEETVITGNVASASGGGIWVSSNNGQVKASIVASTISDNEAPALGGGLLVSGQSGEIEVEVVGTTFSGNSSGNGGGIFNNGNNGVSTISIVDSTLSGNTVLSGGGGLANNGNLGTATVLMTNSTLSENTAKSGGGLANSNNGGTGEVELSYVTIAGNTGTFGDAISNSAQMTVQSSILAHTTGVACDEVALGPITSLGFNLATDDSCALAEASDLNSTDAGLSPLALNAPGTTETMALTESSAAIDAIPDGSADCGGTITSDQRGVVRPANGACDIGAFEVEDEIVVPPPECEPPYTAGTEAELNKSIACVNDAGAGTHTVTLTADILLTGPATTWDNPAADELRLEGDNLTVDGGGTGTVFSIASGSVVTLRNVTIANGQGSSGTTSDLGGGIYNLGDLSLENVTVSGSTAASGGGLYSEGSVTVERSTFSGNNASGAGGAAFIQGNGATATFFVVNSTFSGNGAAEGGAIAAEAGGGSADVALGFVTLAENASPLGSAVQAKSGSTFTAGSTIFAGDDSQDVCATAGGNLVSAGYNLGSDDTCDLTMPSDLANVDPGLATLAINAPGGTATHALQSTSPAFNRIPAGANGCDNQVTIDQRGAPRPYPAAGQCDVGAYEAQFDPEQPPAEEFILFLPVLRG